ncbi:MAG: hypothetical protein J4G11_08525 [Acidimicrobiia bacterium]|nr:hypothetical protein [Acidimicrobiia bacterium]
MLVLLALWAPEAGSHNDDEPAGVTFDVYTWEAADLETVYVTEYRWEHKNWYQATFCVEWAPVLPVCTGWDTEDVYTYCWRWQEDEPVGWNCGHTAWEEDDGKFFEWQDHWTYHPPVSSDAPDPPHTRQVEEQECSIDGRDPDTSAPAASPVYEVVGPEARRATTGVHTASVTCPPTATGHSSLQRQVDTRGYAA